MTWKNSTDPVVDSIRITWTLDKNTKKVNATSERQRHTRLKG